MTIDQETSLRIEAIKCEQDEIKKFKMYVEYIKDLTGKSGAADLLKLDFDVLTVKEFEIYKNMVFFLKSLNENNCGFEMIKEQCEKIVNESRSGSNASFSGWIINTMSPLPYVDFMADGWDGDGQGNRSIKKMVENCINYFDPEKLF